jgi:hypothetical protein
MKNYHEAVEVARFIKNYEFVYILFINKSIDLPINDFVEEWGSSFLLGLVKYSCSTIVESAKDKPSYEVNIFIDFF